MIFILRIVAILFVFSFIVYVLKAIARLSRNFQKTAKELARLREKESPSSLQMVRCASCGAFVTPSDVVKIVSGGRTESFCSRECIISRAKSA